MLKPLMAVIIFLSATSFAVTNSDHVFITIGSDALERSSRSVDDFEIIKEGENTSLVRIPTAKIEELSELMHDHFHLCNLELDR